MPHPQEDFRCLLDSSAIHSSCRWEGSIQPTSICYVYLLGNCELLQDTRAPSSFPSPGSGFMHSERHRHHAGGGVTSPLLQASGPGPQRVLTGPSQPTGNFRQELERSGEIVGSLRLKSGSGGRGGPLTVICLDKRGFCHSVSDTPGETKTLQIGCCPLPKTEGAPGRLDAFASR